jgi:hypothetical protein
VDGETELLEVVAALHACRSLTDFLDCWQEQPDENRDNGDYHQQLNQRER